MSALAPVWQLSDTCAICKTSFGLLTRRHHCRKCGSSVCDLCTARDKYIIHGYKDAQLVCKLCVSKTSFRAPQSISPGFSVIPTAYAPPQELPQQARANQAAAMPDLSAAKEPWICRKCFFNNHASVISCSVCSTHCPPRSQVSLVASCGNCKSTVSGPSGSRAKCPHCFCFIVFPSTVEPPCLSLKSSEVVSPFNSALWDCEACTYVNGAMFGRCEMCNAAPPRVDSWDCRGCTYENAWEKALCEMCRASRPAPQISYIMRQSKLPSQPALLTQEEKDLQFALSESAKEVAALNEKEARLAREYEEALARILEISAQSERRRVERERVELELKEANRLREEKEHDTREFKQPALEIDEEQKVKSGQAEREAEREQEQQEALTKQESERHDRLEREREENEQQARLRREAEEKADEENTRRAQEDLQKRMQELTELRQEQQRRLKELAAKSEKESDDMLSQWRNEAGVQKVTESTQAEVRVHVADEQKVAQTEQQERRQVLETLYQHIGENKEALRVFMSQSSQFKKHELSSEQYTDIICNTFPEESLRTVVPLLLRELSIKNRDMALSLKEALRAKLNK